MPVPVNTSDYHIDHLKSLSVKLNFLPMVFANVLKDGKSVSWLSYTLFAPTSSAFASQMPLDAADPLLVDANFRRKVLLRHLVHQHLTPVDIANSDNLMMSDFKKANLTHLTARKSLLNTVR